MPEEDVEDVLSFGLRKLGYSELRESQRKVVEPYMGKTYFFVRVRRNRCVSREC